MHVALGQLARCHTAIQHRLQLSFLLGQLSQPPPLLSLRLVLRLLMCVWVGRPLRLSSLLPLPMNNLPSLLPLRTVLRLLPLLAHNRRSRLRNLPQWLRLRLCSRLRLLQQHRC